MQNMTDSAITDKFVK